MKFLNIVKSVFYAVVAFIAEHKITSAVTVAAVAGVTATVLIVTSVLTVEARSSEGLARIKKYLSFIGPFAVAFIERLGRRF